MGQAQAQSSNQPAVPSTGAGWALITGGSTGIGRALAEVFAKNQFNLILVARNQARLSQAAGELAARYGVQARVLARDLTEPDAPRRIFGEVGGTPVRALVNNAGFGWRGAFAEGDLERCALDMMRVNMDALVALTHLFLPQMLGRREGRILNVASTAAFQPGPFTTIYFATKAFVFSFSVALAEELAGTGVTVTTLCPGTTRTEFFERAGMKASRRDLIMMEAKDVAEAGYRGLMRGRPVVIPGPTNKLTSTLARLAPARWTAKIVRRINGR